MRQVSDGCAVIFARQAHLHAVEPGYAPGGGGRDQGIDRGQHQKNGRESQLIDDGPGGARGSDIQAAGCAGRSAENRVSSDPGILSDRLAKGGVP